MCLKKLTQLVTLAASWRGPATAAPSPRKGPAGSPLRPFPRREAALPGASCGGPWAGGRQPLVPPPGDGPGCARCLRVDPLELLHKMSRRGEGRAGGALARRVGLPRVAGGAGGGGRGPTCAPSAPPAAPPARGRWGPQGRQDLPAALLPGPGTRAAAEGCLSSRPPGRGLHVAGSRRLYFGERLLNRKGAACAAVLGPPGAGGRGLRSGE